MALENLETGANYIFLLQYYILDHTPTALEEAGDTLKLLAD